METKRQDFRRVTGAPVVGSLLDVWQDAPGTLLRGLMEVGDHARFRFGPVDYLQISDPEDVRHVLVTNAKNYKKSPNYEVLKLGIGKGLVTSEGDVWRRQRKLAQPAFTPRALERFVEPMAWSTEQMLQRWHALDEIDVHQEMMRLTFRIIGLTIASKDLDGEAQEFGRALSDALHFLNDYAETPFRVPVWVPLPAHVKFKSAMAVLDRLVNSMIRERRKQLKGSGAPDDLLTALMQAQDEGTAMSDDLLADELKTLVVAGHETTANALSWTFLLLSRNPGVARRVAQEVAEVLGDEAPTADHLRGLVYTEQVLRESMRLFPPVWAIERQAIGEDVVSGHRIPAGGIVVVSPWVLHRHPDYWENPEGFDPDRFEAERHSARHRYLYLPFGAGPRVCIGGGFAMLEAKLITAMVLRRHRLHLVSGQNIELDPGITLRPRNGIRVRLRSVIAEAA